MPPLSRLTRLPSGLRLRSVGLASAFVVFGLAWVATAAPLDPAPGAKSLTAGGPVQGSLQGAPPAATSVQVSLPLAEYEKLATKPSVTVIDTLRLAGTFSARDLSLVLFGRAAGLGPKVEVLTAPPSVSIYGCEGEAILSKNPGGLFELVPLAARFTLRCRVATASSDRLQLETTAAVLWAESHITDGELIRSSGSSDTNKNHRSLAVVRVSGGSGEVLKPSATARYRITLQPDATLYTYQLEVLNPNRSHQPFTVELRSGEHVQKVDAAVSFEPSANAYRFELPPGEQTLTLSGTLPRPTFTPPVSASVHYLLVESHPLLRPNVTTTAQLISAQETGLFTQFRGARGFLLSDGEKLSWQVLRLEALRTTSFAINKALHTFFLAGDGQALAETVLHLDNQGAPALSLPMRAEPSFASLQHEPVLLTRDDSGHLFLPLSHGQQEVLVQHRQLLRRFGGFAMGTLWLPALSVPASSARIELRYGREWVPLYEEFAPELRVPIFDVGLMVGLLVLFLWTERLLALSGATRRYRIGVALLLGLSALTSGWWLVLLCASNLTLSGVLLGPLLSHRKWTLWTLVGALVIGGVICLAGVGIMLENRAAAPMSAKVSSISEYDPGLVRADSAAESKPRGGEARGGSYQGLPAKFLMPSGNEQSDFRREMLASDAGTPRAIYVLLLSRAVLGLSGSLLFGLGLLLLLSRRRQLQRGFFERWQRLRKPPAPAAQSA